MADIDEAFKGKFDSNNILKLNNHTDDIDYFFTQRKVTEYEEIIDKNMNRKKKKKDITHNFIAINIPHYLYLESDKVQIFIRIWGDEQFKYEGNMTNSEGFSPGLLLKLSSDKQLFINLKILMKKDDIEKEKEYVSFISIPKRYQIEPTISN